MTAAKKKVGRYAAGSRDRIGGRGCPSCGSHDTATLRSSAEGLSGAAWCNSCNHKWIPCAPHCRGYRIDVKNLEPPYIEACSDCGVPKKFALRWPEAYRQVSKDLADYQDKLKPID